MKCEAFASRQMFAWFHKRIMSVSFSKRAIEVVVAAADYTGQDGPARKTFRSKYFKQVLRDIHHESLEKQKEILERNYEEWRGNVEQIDDIIVTGIKI